MKALLLALPLWLWLAGMGLTHETTRSYLTLSQNADILDAKLRIAFRDIEVAVWIDEDLDGQITWGETTRRLDSVSDYVLAALTFDAGGTCRLSRSGADVSEDAGVAYLDLTFQGRCADPQAHLRVTSRLFAEFDPDHRLYVTAEIAGVPTTALLSSVETSMVVSGDPGEGSGGFVSYFKEGVRHLMAGADHLVFLLVLILPVVAQRSEKRTAVLGVLVAVTGFTLAHALTLTAALTAILRPPTALIETLIAFSIIIAAIDNLRPFIPAPRAAVAAFFGLIHGFGFATALSGLQLSGSGFATALIGFNLGIEVAQMGVVLALLPALTFLGQGRAVLQIGSLGAVVIGIYWFGQRLLAI